MRSWSSLFKASMLSLTVLAASCGGSGSDGSEALRRGISANPDTIDPHKASAQWENIVIGDMFMGLYTDDINANPEYGVAESHTVSEDGLTWTFTLKDTVWSDGVPVTAGDFEYAYRRILNPETAAQYASLLFLIKNAEAYYNLEASAEDLGVRAIDDKTLEINLEYPAPYLPGLLKHYTSFPVPRHVVEEHGDAWVRPENIVVNGPYKLVEWRTRDYLRSVANPLWEGSEDLCFPEIVYFPYDDLDAIERMMARGKIDMNNAFEGQKKAELEERFPGWVRTAPSLQTTYYAFNTALPMFQDERVRNALAMALDRDFMVDEVLTPGFEPAYAFVPPGIANYDGGASVYWAEWTQERRQEEAKALLEQAGFGPDNPLEFTYTFRSTGDNPRVAPVVQRNWDSIADWVSPRIEMQDTQIQYARLREADFEIGDAGWVADYSDPQNFLYLLESRTGEMNYGNYNNPQYDLLISEANDEIDLEVRKDILLEAEQLMLDDLPVIPMWYQVTQNLVDPTLTGFISNAEDINRSRFVCRTE